jgi:hypothetical protein
MVIQAGFSLMTHKVLINFSAGNGPIFQNQSIMPVKHSISVSH